MQTLKKTVSRTYSLKDGWFYKVQYEYEETQEDGINVKQEYEAISKLLDEQLKEEKERLGL